MTIGSMSCLLVILVTSTAVTRKPEGVTVEFEPKAWAETILPSILGVKGFLSINNVKNVYLSSDNKDNQTETEESDN